MAGPYSIIESMKAQWQSQPAYIRRMNRWWMVVVPLSLLIAGFWVLRGRFWTAGASEPWVSMVMPLSIFVPQFVAMFMFARTSRRLRRELERADYRLCTNCIHDLSGLGDECTCPECGKAFHAEFDVRAWKGMNWRGTGKGR
jgi:hypothetical protein